jgi:hypothetical protein
VADAAARARRRDSSARAAPAAAEAQPTDPAARVWGAAGRQRGGDARPVPEFVVVA